MSTKEKEIESVIPAAFADLLERPVLAHVALAEVFGIKPEGEGLSLDRLLANHLDILFHGLCAAPEEVTP